MNFLLVFLGGGIGSTLRYFIGVQVQRTQLSLPLATFLANFAACMVYALTLWYCQNKIPFTANAKLLLLTGFCGGLSTFSAFGYETFLMLKQGQNLYALVNIIGSTSVCVLIFYIFR